MSLSPLHHRILSLSYKHRLSHIGSSIGAANILLEIYRLRKPDEPVILSSGHGFLGWACVLEQFCGKDAEELFLRHGVHPNLNENDGIFASTGSLGLGLCLSVGRALSNRKRNVWCVISDGELTEGATYEALTFAYRAGLSNLHVYLNANGFSAMREVPWSESVRIARELLPSIRVRTERPDSYGIPFLNGLDAHYHVMSEEDWKWVAKQDITI